MGDRWVKLYEKIEDSSIYHDSELVHLWIHLMIKASKFGNRFPWNGGEIKLNPGQLLTGRKKLHDQTGISESKIQRALKRFEKCHMIEQQTTNKNRIITVLNWDKYQSSEQQTNSKRTSNEQVTNNERTGNEHNQERKKERKKEISSCAPDPENYQIPETLKKWSDKKGISFDKLNEYIETCLTWHSSKGNKHVKWDKTIQTWINKDIQQNGTPKNNKYDFL